MHVGLTAHQCGGVHATLSLLTHAPLPAALVHRSPGVTSTHLTARTMARALTARGTRITRSGSGCNWCCACAVLPRIIAAHTAPACLHVSCAAAAFARFAPAASQLREALTARARRRACIVAAVRGRCRWPIPQLGGGDYQASGRPGGGCCQGERCAMCFFSHAGPGWLALQLNLPCSASHAAAATQIDIEGHGV